MIDENAFRRHFSYAFIWNVPTKFCPDGQKYTSSTDENEYVNIWVHRVAQCRAEAVSLFQKCLQKCLGELRRWGGSSYFSVGNLCTDCSFRFGNFGAIAGFTYDYNLKK